MFILENNSQRIFLLLVIFANNLLICLSAKLGISGNQEYAEAPNWYLSSADGNDTKTCGRNLSTPCKNLNWLLDRFYNDTYPINNTLILGTDSDLLVDSRLVANHSWVQDLSAVIFSVTQSPISIDFINVTMNVSHWTIHAINARISYADLSNTVIVLHPVKEQKSVPFEVNILNSTFGQLIASGFHINLTDCYIDGNNRLQATLLAITDCKLYIETCTFSSNNVSSGSTILTAYQSKITMKTVHFENNCGSTGLIEIQEESNFEMKGFNFTFNGNDQMYQILMINNSTATLDNGIFHDNEALNGIINVSNNSNMYLEATTFRYNTQLSGAAVVCEYHSKLTSNGSLFEENQTGKSRKTGNAGAILALELSVVKLIATNFTGNYARTVGGALSVLQSSGCLIDYCIFFANRADSKGGALYVQNSQVALNNTKFKGNLAIEFGGALTAAGRSRINIVRTNFSENKADLKGGALLMDQDVAVNITHSKFTKNEAGLDCTAIFSTNNSSLWMSYTRFTHETAHDEAGVVCLQKSSSLSAISCTFEKNHCYVGAMFTTSGNVAADFQNCSFQNNTCGLLIARNTSVSISDSVIRNNTVKHKALFDMSYYSNISILKTYITGHLSPTQITAAAIILVESQSLINLTQSVWSGNLLPTHVWIKDHAHGKISECNFFQNTGKFCGIFYVQSRSDLNISYSNFSNNEAEKGAIAQVLDSSLIMDSCNMENNSASHLGGAAYALNSDLHFKNCTIEKISPPIHERVIYAEATNSYNRLCIQNCTFKTNNAHKNNAIVRTDGYSDINIQGSSFQRNYGTVFAIVDAKRVRMADTVFDTSHTYYTKTNIEFASVGSVQTPLNLSTLHCVFKGQYGTLDSNDTYFMEKATSEEIITIKDFVDVQQSECCYASIVPVKDNSSDSLCYCHYDHIERVNVYNCSAAALDRLPPSIPQYTDYLILQNNSISDLCETYKYLETLSSLDVSNSTITRICKGFLQIIAKKKRLKILNLANNHLTSIPQEIDTLNMLQFMDKLLLSGNSFTCDCPITWMIKWITLNSAKIIDYKDLICSGGDMDKKPIYCISGNDMKCYPTGLTKETQVIIAVVASTVLVLFIASLVAVTKVRDLKFFFFYYLRLDTIPKDDENEDLEKMEYDAFFCYSQKDFSWIKDVFMKEERPGSRRFDIEKEYGFRLMIHQRDFIPGRTIRSNIMYGMEHSRRVIFILSRNFLKSKWGMEEFMIADAEAVNGRKNYVIIILIERLNQEGLPAELKNYMRTYTYIDATRSTEKVMKKLRFSMPYTPLRDSKRGFTESIQTVDFNESMEFHEDSDSDVETNQEEEFYDIDDFASDDEAPLVRST